MSNFPEQRQGAGMPIDPGSPLGRRLADFVVPDLSPDFADRVVASASARVAALPPLRPARRRWRLGRRVAVGAVALGALASAAAASGLLDKLPFKVPTGEQVWATLTGQEPVRSTPPPPLGPAQQQSAPDATAPEGIDGPIDSTEELDAAFRRIDQSRAQRVETRRQAVDARIDRRLEQRRAAGLPAPTAEDEARLRERLEQVRDRRDERLDGLREQRREGLRQRVESGETLTGQDLIPSRDELGADGPLRSRIEQRRQLSPEARERRIRQFLERREPAEGEQAAEPASTPASPPAEAASQPAMPPQ
jgi:hypothetical protein